MLMTQGINYIRSCFPNPCPLERKLILICHIYSPSCKSKLHIISYDLIKPINNYVNKMLKRGSINPLHVSPYYSLSLLSNCVNKYTVDSSKLIAFPRIAILRIEIENFYSKTVFSTDRFRATVNIVTNEQ